MDITPKSTDVYNFSPVSIVNNSANTITGFIFASPCTSFMADTNVKITAGTITVSSYLLKGVKNGTSWTLNTVDLVGPIQGTWSINSVSGQLTYTTVNIPSFVDGNITFRAFTL